MASDTLVQALIRRIEEEEKRSEFLLGLLRHEFQRNHDHAMGGCTPCSEILKLMVQC